MTSPESGREAGRVRLFVALEVPPPVAGAVEERLASLEGRLPSARWVRPSAYHLTLAFLGETEARELPRLQEHLAPAFAGVRPFTVQLRDGGTFPPRRPARVAWAGVAVVDRDPAVITHLVERVHGALEKAIDWQRDRRPFSLHLTVARPRAPWKRPAVETFRRHLRGSWGEPFEVQEGVLVESRLQPGGARYRPVQRYPLGGAEGDDLG